MTTSGGPGSSRLVVTGVPQLRRALDTMANDLTDMSVVTARTASLIASTAAGMAPRRTGALAGSLRPYAGRFRAGVSSSLPYASPVHWGVPARRVSARPFATRAARATEPVWTAWYLDYLDDLCAAAARSTPRPKGR